MKDSVVAKKYARALFAEAQAKKELRAAQQGLEEFIRIARLRGSLKLILAHPFEGGMAQQVVNGAPEAHSPVANMPSRGTGPAPSVPGNVVSSGRPSAQDLPEYVP